MIESIRKYLEQRFKEKNIKIKYLASGEYNDNYLVTLNNKKYVFRVNFDQQSGLKNQIKYEYKTLKFLEDFGISPKPLFYDDTKTFFKNDVLMYEYVEGRHIKYSEEDIKALAKTFNILHSIKIPKNARFMKRDFIEGDKKFIKEKYEYYKKISDDKPTKEFYEKAMKIFFNRKHNLKPTWTIIHTDPVPTNIIFNKKKAILIDWEKGRVDDPSYDLCPLFSPAMTWGWDKKMDEKHKKIFIENYQGFKHDPQLKEKIRIRYPLTVMWFALWVLIRMEEVKKGIVDKTSEMKRYGEFRDALLEEIKQLIKQKNF
jgi:thiamine kinase-like enzyme